MEVEHRREKETEEHLLRRKDRELECNLRTQKKAMKRRLKKEKIKVIKEGAKQAESVISGKLVSDGSFLDKVREKYGDDVLIKKGESENEDSNSYDSEVDHSSSEEESDGVGPCFEKINPESNKTVQKVEEVKEDGPVKIAKKRMMPATFIPEKKLVKEEEKPKVVINKPRFIIKDDDELNSSHSSNSEENDADYASVTFETNKRIKRDDYE